MSKTYKAEICFYAVTLEAALDWMQEDPKHRLIRSNKSYSLYRIEGECLVRRSGELEFNYPASTQGFIGTARTADLLYRFNCITWTEVDKDPLADVFDEKQVAALRAAFKDLEE